MDEQVTDDTDQIEEQEEAEYDDSWMFESNVPSVAFFAWRRRLQARD